MNVVDFLQDLVLDNWHFWAEDGRLKYRAPREAVTPALLSTLKAHKSEITSLLETEPETFELCPLSYGQRALWFLWQLSPQSSAYNQSLPLGLHRHGDPDAWREACRLLLQQHQMLRTVFPRRRGEPIQQLQRAAHLDWELLDASTWSDARLASEIEKAHAAPFDLEQGPVARFRWFQRSTEDHVLLLTMHHIVCDGWSIEIIRQQLPVLYQQIKHGSEVKPETPVHTYYDYVRWQLDMLQNAEGERLWHFWRTRLCGDLPALHLPTDLPRPAVQTYRGAAHKFSLPLELTRNLKRLAKREGATPYIVLMSTFLVLLHRYTNQDDLLIGSPHAGRTRAEFASIVGYFADPVVIRSAYAGEQTFAEFLGATKRATLQALEHAHFPFALLVEKLRLERDPGRSPLFDVTFNYLVRQASNAADQPPLELVDLPQANGKFDLTLTIMDAGAVMTGSFGYNPDLFQEATVARLAELFFTLLDHLLNHPTQQLKRVPLHPLEEAVCQPVLQGSRIDLQSEHMVHRLFERQAAWHPDAIAVRADETALRYAELNQLANGLAHHLRRLGVGPDTLVAIYSERSVAFVVAILAVHKAGGAYMPLDPNDPMALLHDLLSHAGVTAVLTQSDLLASLPDLDLSCICLDAWLTDLQAGCEQGPETTADLGHLAYVMHTSGSTGRPKGVGIEHRALANYVISMLSTLSIVPRDHFALVSTFSADLGNTVIFPALCSGGCLHILPDAARLDSLSFTEYMQQHQVDYLKITPSHFAALTAFSGADLAMPRKALILGGEGASTSWVQRLQALAPDCLIYNHYGPTEATVGVLTYQVDRLDVLQAPSLPLRTPTANTEIYILDRCMQAVPTGAVGELYIGGACLARGYINAWDLTRNRFVPHPMAEASAQYQNAVLYKTGDLARQRPHGGIEILGRQDGQIKLRGYRIERGHVESVLRDHPHVHDCVVLPAPDSTSATHLLAFVMPVNRSRMSDDFEKEHLKRCLIRHIEQSLPAYMAPSHLVLLDAIPLTPNGKVDVKALRHSVGSERPQQGASLPRDLLELKLSQIWSEVLHVPQVGIDEDFFRLGGHSLLAVRLMSQIYEHFERRLSLATLFTHPTVAKLAEVLRADAGGWDYPVLTPIQPSGDNPTLFCLPGAGGNVLYFYPLSRRLGMDQPCWGLQALGLNEQAAIPIRVEDIASRYVDIIRKEAQPEGPYALVGHSFGAFVAFEMAHQLLRQGQDIAFLGLIDNAAPAATSEDLYVGWSHWEWLKHIAIRIEKLYQTQLHLDNEVGANLSDEKQVEYVIDRLISTRLLPVRLNKTHFGRFIDVYKANVIAAARYRPAPLLAPVRLTLFKALEDDLELKGRADIKAPDLGWGRYTAHPVDVIVVPGTHITMFSEPHVKGLGARLREAMAIHTVSSSSACTHWRNQK